MNKSGFSLAILQRRYEKHCLNYNWSSLVSSWLSCKTSLIHNWSSPVSVWLSCKTFPELHLKYSPVSAWLPPILQNIPWITTDVEGFQLGYPAKHSLKYNWSGPVWAWLSCNEDMRNIPWITTKVVRFQLGYPAIRNIIPWITSEVVRFQFGYPAGCDEDIRNIPWITTYVVRFQLGYPEKHSMNYNKSIVLFQLG